jgi:hypothetical protein
VNSGLTMENFILSGSLLVFNSALQIWVSGEIINGRLDFIILFEISSYSLKFSVF